MSEQKKREELMKSTMMSSTMVKFDHCVIRAQSMMNSQNQGNLNAPQNQVQQKLSYIKMVLRGPSEENDYQDIKPMN